MSYPRTGPPDVSATDRNLWQAIVAEAIAHLTYTAYAQKAREEGYPEVAEVFEEVAKSGNAAWPELPQSCRGRGPHRRQPEQGH